MTIDLTPEELETILDALDEAYGEYTAKAAAWRGRGRDADYREDADRCAALSKRLGGVGEGGGAVIIGPSVDESARVYREEIKPFIGGPYTILRQLDEWLCSDVKTSRLYRLTYHIDERYGPVLVNKVEHTSGRREPAALSPVVLSGAIDQELLWCAPAQKPQTKPQTADAETRDEP